MHIKPRLHARTHGEIHCDLSFVVQNQLAKLALLTDTQNVGKVRYNVITIALQPPCEGLSTKRSPVQYNVLISIAQVPELQCVEVKDDGIEIGAAVTITHLIEELEELQKKLLGAQHL